MDTKQKTLPPSYLLANLIVMPLLHSVLPVYRYLSPPVSYLGVALVLLGVVMVAHSSRAFKRAEAAIVPFDEATILVTGGLYRLTRNPMYLGMLLILFGMAILLGSAIVLFPVLFFFFLIRNYFVLREEYFLEAAFGQEYLDYKSRVRRWI